MKDTVDKLLSELRDDPEAFAKSGVAADGLDAMLAELREPMELTNLVVDELRKHKPGVAMAALAMIIPITLAAVPDELRDLFLARVWQPARATGEQEARDE